MIGAKSSRKTEASTAEHFEKTFETIFEQSPISTQIFNAKGETIRVNKAWEKLWGTTLSEVKNYNILRDKQLVDEKIMPLIKKAFHGEVVEIPAIKYFPEKTIPGATKISHRWTTAVMYPIKDAKNKIQQVVLQHQDVTEKKDVEERLRESEGFFRAVTENSLDAVRLIDPKGNILYASPSTSRILGYTPEEYKRLNLFDLIHPDDKKAYRESVQYILKYPKHLARLEYRIKHKNGTWRWLEGVGRNFLDNPSIGAFMSNYHDITERKEAEHELWETKERFKTIIEVSPLGIYVLNTKGIVEIWNRAAEKIFGWTEKEIVGKKVPTVQKEKIAEYQKLMQRYLSGESCTVEAVRRRKDGSLFNISISASPLMDEQGVVTHVIAIVSDVSERKKAERELWKSNETLKTIINASPLAVYVVDKKGIVLMWNRVSEEIFGWSAEEVIGKKLPIVQSEMAGEFDKLLQKLLKGKPFTKETVRQKKDGTLFDVSISASPIFDQEGNITSVVAITSDISKRKEADRQKDEFIGIVSHELKTPVTSLKAYEQVLQNRFRKSGDDASAGMLLKMDGQINKLTMLIQDLLDVTKIEGGKLQFHDEYFSLIELLDEVIEEVQRTTDTHTIIKKGKSVKKIYGDRDRIGQVVTNLLTNAIKYSAKADRVIVKVIEDEENVTVSVQDFGVGIPKKELPHIFNRFFRVDSPIHRTIPGMGLGLYVSSEIVKRLGGSIWAESAEKKGSTFYFTLPIRRAN